jgi:hypothetical protein
MIFARQPASPAGGLGARPRLLLLTGAEETPGAAAVLAAAVEAGCIPLLLPWMALRPGPAGPAAWRGRIQDGAAARPLGPEEILAPDAIAPLYPLPVAGQAALAWLGFCHPRAVLAGLPLPAGTETLPAGLLALAPPVLRAMRAPEAEARLAALAEALPAQPDPRRILLAFPGGVAGCGFQTAPAAPFDAALFRAWMAAARGRMPPPPALHLPAPAGTDPGHPAHPLAALLPALAADGHVVERTRARADASFAFRDPGLRLAGAAAGEAALLGWLGRSIDPDAPPGPEGDRLVEPGVGRAVLVDRVALDGHPAVHDFTALGIGVTPYAAQGYVNVGRRIDGLAGLARAQHRRRCAERLEAAGCRAGRVAAIIALGDSAIALAHAAAVPAAILVRGFRCALRVKQLDPVAPFLHSFDHAAEAHGFLLHPWWERLQGGAPPDAAAEQGLMLGLEELAQRASLAAVTEEAPAWPGLVAARARRRAAIALYAPLLLDLACTRLAVELGRDPLDHAEYATWFAASLGAQLAHFRRLRFLHEYNQPGTARWTPERIHSLGENNVTLLAEFPDLDTGIFVDDTDAETLDALFLTEADRQVLRADFDGFHAEDLAQARAVAGALAWVALGGEAAGIAAALARFDAAYAAGVAEAAA